ncbi:hypothetical protein V5799_031348 [Amblyomma americanum]|uniref:Uncharacterized protein n=1 Tax=Amblyomma americanum TaxID=6943 RepID=A0AAQ4EKQ9_AMBAM
MGRPPTPRPSLTDCTISSSSPDGQYDELGDGSSRPSRAASEVGVSAAATALRMEMKVLPMAMHEPCPGRQWRSVTFDDAKRRVIATNLDPEVDTLILKSTVERSPTPRPSRTDCTTSSSPDGQYDELGEGCSRPLSAASEDKSLDPEPLMMRLTLECDRLADKDRVATEMPLRRGGGHTDDDELTSEGGGSA